MAKLNPLMVLPLVLSGAMFALVGYSVWVRSDQQNAGIDPDALPSAIAGHEAPPVVVTALGPAAPFTDATLRDGRVKLVNFWASWCAPCRAEHPNLEKLSGEGVAIYGVNYKDKPGDALGLLAELGNPYAAIGADAPGRMGIDWGLYGVPETFVIDGQGKVIARFAGPITERSLASDIRPAMAKAAGQ